MKAWLQPFGYNEMQICDFSEKRDDAELNQKEPGIMDGIIFTWNALVRKFRKK